MKNITPAFETALRFTFGGLLLITIALALANVIKLLWTILLQPVC